MLALMLTAITILGVSACGKSGDSADGTKPKEWAYVPEFLTIEEDNVSYYDMQLVGENLYYLSYDWDESTQTSSQSVCKYSLADKALTKTPITWAEDVGYQSLNRGTFLEDGSFYAIMDSYTEDYSQSWQHLTKFDAQGQQIFSQDITDLLQGSYADGLVVDGEGRVYLSGDGVVWLVDAEGVSKGSVKLEGTNVWIDSMGNGSDGKVYLGYSSYDGNNSTYTLCEIDFEGARLGNSYKDFPRGNNGFFRGTEYDFLIHDGMKVYAYDLEKQKKEELFDWLDSDINGSNVRRFGQLEDGRIVAIVEDWETNDSGIALLTKKKAEEVPQKEIITVGTMSGAYNLQARAVKFNKSNSQYHISVKQYMDFENYGENTWSDALNSFNNDLTSNNCPDIIDLTSMNMSQLAAKGILEDLNPYLEKSSVLNRSDFLENILNVYTVNGALVSIPTFFNMQTVIGSTEKVGTESGWTLDEMIAFANQYPEAEIFNQVSKLEILRAVLMFNQDAFINWETGECNFDSDTFKNILDFVNRFPDEVTWEEGMDSEPTRIQKGEVLLSQAYLYDFDQIQMYSEIFGGDYNCIGFPTVDGTGGHALSTGDAYAISSKSSRKDGAWAFLESILTEESDERFRSGFPTRKAALDAMAAEAVEVDYVMDENGQVMKDENGEPLVSGTSSIGYEDGWEYTYHTPTQEEIDKTLALMEHAKPVAVNGNDMIMSIINEEAEPFFKGQKSVDDVVKVIQNRINNYVNETK